MTPGNLALRCVAIVTGGRLPQAAAMQGKKERGHARRLGWLHQPSAPTHACRLLRRWVDTANPAYVGNVGGVWIGGDFSDLSETRMAVSLMARCAESDHASSMRTYLRNRTVGGTYFFTVNLAERRGSRLLLEHVETLRSAFRRTCLERPFTTIAWVVLPEHLHCLWRLPAGDDDYATRWRLIKSRFSHALPHTERRSASRLAKAERGIWQRRYWEHLVRDAADLRAHVDYIHINPVKHGHAARATDWPHSSFHRFVERGWLAEDWACDPACMRAGEA